jgi:hypothetical protein
MGIIFSVCKPALNVDTFNEIVDLNLSDKNNAMALSRF